MYTHVPIYRIVSFVFDLSNQKVSDFLLQWERQTKVFTKNYLALGITEQLLIGFLVVFVSVPPLLWVPQVNFVFFITGSLFWIFLTILQHLVGIPISYNITINCSIEIHPTSLNYWTRDNGSEHIVDSEKYKYVVFIRFWCDFRSRISPKDNFWPKFLQFNFNCLYRTEFVNNLRSSYKFEMRLTIYNVEPEDYGLYRWWV